MLRCQRLPADDDCHSYDCVGSTCVETVLISGDPCLLTPNKFCDERRTASAAQELPDSDQLPDAGVQRGNLRGCGRARRHPARRRCLQRKRILPRMQQWARLWLRGGTMPWNPLATPGDVRLASASSTTKTTAFHAKARGQAT